MQETRWESKEPSNKESASLDLELRRHRMSGPSAVRRKSIVRTFLGAVGGCGRRRDRGRVHAQLPPWSRRSMCWRQRM